MEGTWLDGKLHGRVTADNDYGGWEVNIICIISIVNFIKVIHDHHLRSSKDRLSQVAHFKQGLRHGYCLDLGPYVHFSSQGDKPENLKRC